MLPKPRRGEEHTDSKQDEVGLKLFKLFFGTTRLTNCEGMRLPNQASFSGWSICSPVPRSWREWQPPPTPHNAALHPAKLSGDESLTSDSPNCPCPTWPTKPHLVKVWFRVDRGVSGIRGLCIGVEAHLKHKMFAAAVWAGTPLETIVHNPRREPGVIPAC